MAGLCDELGELLGQVDIRLLKNVGGVDPPLEAAVEPEPDHLPEPLPVAVEELGQGGFLAPRGAVYQIIKDAIVNGHNAPLYRRPARPRPLETTRPEPTIIIDCPETSAQDALAFDVRATMP